LEGNDVAFFYGSSDNSFWHLFLQAMDLPLDWPTDYLLVEQWLLDNHWAISDIVLETERKNDTAKDADLSPKKWNVDIIDDILEVNPIKHIFFTSNWVANNFKKHLQPKLKHFKDSLKCHILISPSPSGLISTRWAQNILPRLEKEPLSAYRLRYYSNYLGLVKY
jgi:hypothetical protein